MNDVVVLSNSIAVSRYAGPYTASTSAREKGYQVKILDFFTKHPDIEEYIRPHISPKTKLLAISTTFIYQKTEKNLERQDYYNILVGDAHCLHCDSEEELRVWFQKIRRLLPKDCKIALAGERVNKIYIYWEQLPDDHPLKTEVDFYFLARDDHALLKYLENQSFTIKKDKFLWSSESSRFASLPIPVQIFTEQDCVAPNEVLSAEISRGCAFNCKYCEYDKATFNKLDMKTVQQTFEHYYDKFGVTKYHFTTDCFNDNINFVKEFHQMQKSLAFDLQWISYARPDLCWKYPEVPELMLESGAVSNHFGVETMNHSAAKTAGRGLHFDKILKVFEQFKILDPNYWIFCYFIIGLPNDTKESILAFAEWMKVQTTIDSAKYEVLTLRPHPEDVDNLWDSAEFVVDPKKYGFEEVQFFPELYWKHSTMDIEEAKQLKEVVATAQAQNSFFSKGRGIDELLTAGVAPSQWRKAFEIGQKDEILTSLKDKIINSYFDRITNI